MAAAIPALFGPLLIGDAVDAIREGDRSSLERFALIIAVLAVGTAVLAAIRMVCVTRVTYRIEAYLRQKYYDHLFTLDLATLEHRDPGQLVARGTSDLRAIRVLFSSGVPTTAQAVATFIFVAVALLIEEAALSTVAFVMAISIALIGRRQANTATGLQRTVRTEMGELAHQTEQALGGITVIKAFGRENELIQRFHKSAQRALAAVRKVSKRDAIYNATLGAFPLAGLCVVMVVGGTLAIDGEALTHGQFVTFFMYFLLMASPAVAVGRVMVLAQDGSAAAVRIEEILSLPSRYDSEKPGSNLEPGGASVNFHDASASYDRANDVIDGFDLSVPRGSLIGLVGANGSGKSMALSLLKDLYPLGEGKIEINGVQQSDLARVELQRGIGIVCDHDFLFDGSLRDAIAYGRPEATLDEVKQVAKLANIDQFIEGLPNGYETRIGERGALLSGGQRQRVAFARTLLTNPKVMLSDDAGASLDTPTANAVVDAIRTDAPERTMLIVSRRPSVLEKTDLVVVLDQGRVIDSGTHSELMARSELYRSITSSGYNKKLAPEPVASSAKSHASKTHQVDSSSAVEHRSINQKPRSRESSLRNQGALIWNVLKVDRRLLAMAAVALILMTIGSLAPAWISGRVVDDVLGGGNRGELYELSAALLGASLIWSVATGYANFFVPWIGQRTMMRLRERLFNHLMRIPMAYYDTASPGRVLSKLVYALDILASVFQQSLNTVVTALLMMFGTAIALLVIDPLLALIAYVTAPVVFLLSRVMIAVRRRENRHSLAGMTALTQSLLETVRGMRVIRSFATEKRHSDNFADLNRQERLSLRRVSYSIGTFSLFAELVMGFALAAMVWVGGEQAIDGTIAVGTMVVLTMYLRMALSPISELATVGVTAAQIGPAIDSAKRLLDVREDRRQYLSESPHEHLERVRGAIKFENVSFAYTRKRWALHDVSCAIEAGSSVAITGPSGAGKTTFARLLMGFYPAVRGRVLLDGTDLSKLDSVTLRSHMSLVPQEPFLFNGTVADNIAFGKQNASRDDVDRIVEQCGFGELLGKLPDGLDTIVDSGGSTISSGQRQLVALCRALIADPSVLLLDEATSVLDGATESALQSVLDRERGKRTTISIVHRIELCERSDLVLVFTRGRLVESGTHAQLRAAGGEYAKLWKASFDA